MPSFTFVLPHWTYWGTLFVFPFVAMYMARRQRRHGAPQEPLMFTAYLFWLCSGFMGLHRMYLKSWWGFVYLPFFVAILYCNSEVRESRDDVSRTTAVLEQAQTVLKYGQPADAAAPTPEERKSLTDADTAVRARQTEYDAAKAVQDRWKSTAGWLAIVIAALLVVDAFLIPALVRKRRAAAVAAGYAADPVAPAADVPAHGTAEDPTLRMHSRFTDWIDRINARAGEYVAYWAIVSVFAYYYEVTARFVFNSPTNWVHESMFLMFGMQYMMSGAYAYREDQHVRVDVFYTKFSAARQGDRRHHQLALLLHLHADDVLDRLALRCRRGQQPRDLVHRVGHPVLAGQADDPDRRRADHPAGPVQADQGHHDPHAKESLRWASRFRSSG